MMTEQQALDKARRLSENFEGEFVAWWDESQARYRVDDEFDFDSDFDEDGGDERCAVFESGTETA